MMPMESVRRRQSGSETTKYLVDKNRDYAQVLEERSDTNALIVSYLYGDDLDQPEARRRFLLLPLRRPDVDTATDGIIRLGH